MTIIWCGPSSKEDEELTRQYPTERSYQIEAWLKDNMRIRSLIRDIPGIT